MADAQGNVVPSPMHSTKSAYFPVEILASTRGGVTQWGCTLLGGQGVLAAGTVLGNVTASGKCVAYVSSAGDGSQKPIGFLREDVDTGTSAAGTSQDMQGTYVPTGILNSAVLPGYLSAGTFSASTSVAGSLDTNAQTLLGGRFDPKTGFFIFG